MPSAGKTQKIPIKVRDIPAGIPNGAYQLIAFVDAVCTRTTPVVTGDQGVASLEIAIQCLANSSGSAAAKARRRVAGG